MKNLVLFSRIATALTTILLALNLLVRRVFGVTFRQAEVVWSELSELLTRKAVYKSGRYEEFYTGDYLQQILDLASELEKDMFNPFNPNSFKYARLVREAKETHNDLSLQNMNTLLRPQPFGILIAGLPGTGKSLTAMKAGALILKTAGIEPTQRNMITLNEGDDFQSEFRSYHKCVIFDDLGATRASLTGQDPYRKVIDFINNVPRTSLNPHLELKGNVWIEPEVVIATTNLDIPFSMKSGQQNNTEPIMCKAAIDRRFKLMLYQHEFDQYSIVPPDFKGNNKILPRFAWKEIEPILLRKYTEHHKGQESYLKLMGGIIPSGVRADLRPESSSLGWYCVIGLQAIVRYYYHDALLSGNVAGTADFLLLLRKFLALPLDTVRSEQRRKIVDQLFELGLSRRVIAEMLDSRAGFVRHLTGLIPAAIEVIVNTLHGRPIHQVIAKALALKSFDITVRNLFSHINHSGSYDMVVHFFGSSAGWIFRAKAKENGYANRYAEYFWNNVRNATSSWSNMFVALIASLPLVSQFLAFWHMVGSVLDVIAGAFRPRKVKAEAKKLPAYYEDVTRDMTFFERKFRFAYRIGKFTNCSEDVPTKEYSYKPELVTCFIDAMFRYTPTSLTVEDFLKALGATRFGDVYVSPKLQLEGITLTPGSDFLIVYDPSLESLFVLFLTELPEESAILRLLTRMSMRKRVNAAFVYHFEKHLQLNTVYGSQVSSLADFVWKLQKIPGVPELILKSGVKFTPILVYRAVKQRVVNVTDKEEKLTPSNDSVEDSDRAAESS